MLDTASGAAPSEVVQRANALVPLLRGNAAEAERLRRLPESTIAALEEAEIFRVIAPAKRGGLALDAATLAAVMTTISSACPSTAWVLMIYHSVAQLAELLSEQALAEIYAGSHTKIAGVFGKAGAVAVRADGGFRLRGGGAWPFNSGCRHASWDLLRLNIEESDGSIWGAFAAVPLSDLVFNDDWDVMGAAGTGSNSVSCGEIFIPEHRVAKVPKDMRGVIRADSSVATSCALPLGMARYALESFIVLAKEKSVPFLGYARMGDAPVVQAAVAKGAADVKLIESYQQWALSTLNAESAAKDAGLLGIGSVRCFELARDLIESLFALCPSGEIHLTRPIERLLRDVHVFQRQQAATPFINYELYGRRLFAS